MNPPPCRALRVKGHARFDGGASLVDMTPLDGIAWIDLDAGAEVSVRHGVSAREFSLTGKGRFLPCYGGLEQVLLSEGVFRSSPGSGVRPGAEVWVATPFGALRYGDGNLEVRVEATTLSVRVQQGQAFTEASAPSGLAKLTLSGPKASAKLKGRPPIRALVTACSEAATRARSSAAALMASTGTPLGELARAQLESRRQARAQCLVAESGLGQADNPTEVAALREELGRANEAWKAIPAPAPR